MARSRKSRHGRERRLRRNAGRGSSLIGRAKRTVLSPFFWGLFALVGVVFAAFWTKPLDMLAEGGAKLKSMINLG